MNLSSAGNRSVCKAFVARTDPTTPLVKGLRDFLLSTGDRHSYVLKIIFKDGFDDDTGHVDFVRPFISQCPTGYSQKCSQPKLQLAVNAVSLGLV